LPPGGFVAAAVYLAMMSSAYWHSEFVANLAPEGTALRKTQVMGI
jgi:hypothetical protein